MTRGKKILALAELAIAIAGLLAFAVLVSTPTPPPPQWQVDFLGIASVASAVHEDCMKGSALNQQCVSTAIANSEGLVQSAEALSPNAVQLVATMAPRSGGRKATVRDRVPVTIRIEFVPGEGGSGTRKCFGRPHSALPSSCGPL